MPKSICENRYRYYKTTVLCGEGFSAIFGGKTFNLEWGLSVWKIFNQWEIVNGCN